MLSTQLSAKLRPLLKCLFFAGYSILLITDSCKKIGFINDSRHILNAVAYSFLVICGALSLSHELKHNIRSRKLFIMLLSWIIGLATFLASNNFTFVRIAIVITSVGCLDFKETVCADLLLKCVIFCALIALPLLNLMPFTTLLRADGSVRYAFGFEHPNALSTYIFSIVSDMLILYFIDKKGTKVRDMLFAGFVAMMAFSSYFVMNSQAATLALVLISIYLLLHNFINRMLCNKAMLLLLRNTFILLSVITFSLTLLSFINPSARSFLDKLFSNRFSNFLTYIGHTGFSFFGTSRPYSINGAYLDSMALGSLLNFGIAAFGFLCVITRKSLDRMFRDNRPETAFLFIIALFLGFTDTNMMLPTQNILLVYFAFLNTRDPSSAPQASYSSARNIYFCTTYYHVLIATVKEIVAKSQDPMIALCSNWGDRSLVADNRLLARLKKSNVFSDITTLDIFKIYGVSDNINEVSAITKLKIMESYKKQPLVEIPVNSNVFLFSDAAFIGRIINHCGYKYHLIEDGLDCFISNAKNIKARRGIHYALKRLLGMRDMGESKNIIDVEVNNKSGVNLPNKVIEVPRKSLFSKLSVEDKQIIVSIFLPKIPSRDLSLASIIITQPFYDDGFLDSAKQQVRLYGEIIRNYCHSSEVIIKMHPRETTDYSPIAKSKRVIILKDKYPIELLNFLPNTHFGTAITVSSTSLSTLNANNKILLGWEYLDNFKKEIRSGKK